MKAEDFDLLSRMLHERSGLVLTPDKSYLLESRLMPVARSCGAKGLDELVAMLRKKPDAALTRAITEAMTTNETLFFRDVKPFEQFRRAVLPGLIKQRRDSKTIRIWCAASSSGQEPYSLAMVLREEQAMLHGWKVQILGTDLNTELVSRARAGLYSQFEVQRGLPIQMLVKYFTQIEDKWQIAQAIRDLVEFREFNLLHDPRVLGQFDVVFCRNVLIYFDQASKTQILDRLAHLMPADGILYLGGAETVFGVTERFEPVPHERGIYRPVAKTNAKAPQALV
jgi:chemotaxis protein methyltransferase CheR